MGELAKDYLTGLLTRQGLYEWYGELEEKSLLQFMFMDLDNFKSVNDTYGHNVGDELLKAVANILKDCMEQVVCARLGGDEFVVVAKGKCEREDMTAAAAYIIDKIRKKEGFQSIYTEISASIGILLDEISDKPLNEILFKIDTAMYEAKNQGKSCYVVFNDIADKVYDEVQMEHHQVEALQKGEFEVWYQPIISAQTSKLFLSEARLVWNMPDGKRRNQSEFLPLFEKNGFIRSLNLWLFEVVCKDLEYYHSQYQKKGKVCVRISRLLLMEKDLPKLLQSIMEIYSVEAGELYLEVEESIFAGNNHAILDMLKRLKEEGFSISVGEIGIGFGSLKYWDKLLIDSIKFNAEYLQSALCTQGGRQIIKNLLFIGHDLKMKVIADGISKKEDVIFLCNCGCNAISGAFYSEALSGKNYREYVKDKIVSGEQKRAFPFQKDFRSEDGKYEGIPLGDGITLAQGISPKWGSVCFHGGEVLENVMEFPSALLAEESYTIGMWLKLTGSNGWSSAFYARYLGGFSSYVPFLADGNSVFRVGEDADISNWHDTLSRQLQENIWYFICITFDALTGTVRYYINGRKSGYLREVPLLPVCKQILIGGDPFQKSYQGYLSGLTFYDNAKSEDEIEAWYKEFLAEEGYVGGTENFWMEKCE